LAPALAPVLFLDLPPVLASARILSWLLSLPLSWFHDFLCPLA
jgi:hypothetical protein